MTAIRRAVAIDAGALAEFGARTFRDAFAADNRPEDIALYLGSTYGPPIQAGELADPRLATLIVESEGRLAGYAQLRDVPPPDCINGPRPLELWRFYVDRPWHGTGLAQALMAATLAAAAERGAGTLWLCVWERNLRAIGFYRKSGFEDRGSQEFVLGTDRQTDRVMARVL